MERARALVACCALAAAGCEAPSVLLSLGATDEAAQGMGGYCVALGADGARRFGQRYALADEPLPQTLGVTGGGHALGSARLDGLRGGLRGPSASSALTFSGHGTSDVSLGLAACTPRAAATTLVGRPALTIAADQIALVRSGAEAAGTAELVALAGSGGGRFRFDAGVPTLEPAPALQNGARSPVSAMLAFDVDGDCADDLLIAPAGLPPAAWTTGTDGAPSPASSVPAVPPSISLAAADVDGDGWADLLTAGDDGVAVLLSDRQRGFVERPNPADVQPTGAQAIALGDLDGDGTIDLLVGFAAGSMRWLRGDRTGLFRLQTPALPGSFDVQQLLVADLDGDGDLDVLAAVRNGSPGLRVLLNDGHGLFTDVTTMTVPLGVDATMLALVRADLDGDCVDELVAIGDTTPPRWLAWLAGELVDRGPIGAARRHAGVAADLDGDGVVDLALAGASEVTIYSTAMPPAAP